MTAIPATEQRNPASYQIDTKSTKEILSIINNEDKKIASVVESSIPQLADLIDCLVDVFKKGGRLFYLGAGTSGRLGVLDASECPPTYGVSPDMVQGLIAGGDTALRKSVEGAEDDKNHGIDQLKEAGFSRSDMLVGITASGSAPYVLGAMEYARSLGSPVGAISCNKDSSTFNLADFAIFLPVGPEIVTGSTRMKSGTAQKMALNMITTTAMIKLGKVYNNFMIDLMPVNAKLVERSKRLINEITGCGEEKAAKAFEDSGHKIRTAIIMASLDVDKEKAEHLLEKGRGNINLALDAYKTETKE
ncbi:N-acetylmuramic acid 6-phosphate etherase [Treponema sp. OMZ 840]|uniref:N-acetylmuramic acid 6-phosphate etherase n=1 Tax=Treponema sp. OMZ 840 TaxID=244313 RepID=UPI003D92D1C4